MHLSHELLSCPGVKECAIRIKPASRYPPSVQGTQTEGKGQELGEFIGDPLKWSTHISLLVRIPTPSRSSLSFSFSSMDLHFRSYRPDPPHLSPTPRFSPPSSPLLLAATMRQRQHDGSHSSAPITRHTSHSLSSTYPLVHTPSEISYQNTPSTSANLQHEQSTFLNPGQPPWSESPSGPKVESSPVPHQVLYADTAGSYPSYNDTNGNTAGDARRPFAPHPQRRQPAEMLLTPPQQPVYFNPAAEIETEMDSDLGLRYPRSSRPPHGLPASTRAFVHPSGVKSPSPPAFGAHAPLPRVRGLLSPPGLTGEPDEDPGSESGESNTAELSDGPDGDDDGDFLPNRASRSRTRSRRTSSGSAGPTQPCHLSAPVPVPNLTKKSRGRHVPTTPVFMVQGGVPKNERMYKCMVDGCNKSFARGEHLKRHVRSVHTNEKRELVSFLSSGPRADLVIPSQRTSALSKDAGRTSVVTITSGSTCAYTRVKFQPMCWALDIIAPNQSFCSAFSFYAHAR